MALNKAKSAFATALPGMQVPAKGGGTAAAAAAAPSRWRWPTASGALEHGAVVIAAITSCTNTSNPERHDRRRPAGEEGGGEGPHQQAVGEEQPGAGLEGGHRVPERRGAVAVPRRSSGFNLVGYGCTTCIGNSGPLPDDVSAVIREKNLVVASVLSGNRNFEGRIQQEVRANYLASPPLVVAYALAGTITKDLTTEPLGDDAAGTAGLPEGHLADRAGNPDDDGQGRHAGDVPPQLRRASSPATSAGRGWRCPRAAGSRGRPTPPTSASRRSSTA